MEFPRVQLITNLVYINFYIGMLKINRELEEIVAKFVGKEDAICFPMGFSTNSANIQVFLDEDCCIVSDELNHASLVLASRLAGCKIFIYKHNGFRDFYRYG